MDVTEICSIFSHLLVSFDDIKSSILTPQQLSLLRHAAIRREDTLPQSFRHFLIVQFRAAFRCHGRRFGYEWFWNTVLRGLSGLRRSVCILYMSVPTQLYLGLLMILPGLAKSLRLRI